jgi:hypothetical protein
MTNPDLLCGMPSIAAYINRSPRSAYHLRDRGLLPVFNFGGRLCALKSAIDAKLAELARQAREAQPGVAAVDAPEPQPAPEPTVAQPQKRRPGRPKGSKNKPKLPPEQTALSAG